MPDEKPAEKSVSELTAELEAAKKSAEDFRLKFEQTDRLRLAALSWEERFKSSASEERKARYQAEENLDKATKELAKNKDAIAKLIFDLEKANRIAGLLRADLERSETAVDSLSKGNKRLRACSTQFLESAQGLLKEKDQKIAKLKARVRKLKLRIKRRGKKSRSGKKTVKRLSKIISKAILGKRKT